MSVEAVSESCAGFEARRCAEREELALRNPSSPRAADSNVSTQNVVRREGISK